MNARRWLGLLSTSLLVACGAETTSPVDGNDVTVGKSDFSGKPTMTITGDRERTLSFDTAFQCEIGQFSALASWHNAGDDPGYEFPTMRLVWVPNPYRVPAVGDVYSASGDGSGGWISFDGLGFSSERGDSCALVLEGYSNSGQGGRAGFVLSTQGCQLRTNDGKTIALSGEVGCSGAGFNWIDLGQPPDETDTVGGDDAVSDDVVEGDAVEDDAVENDTDLSDDAEVPVDTVPVDTTPVDPCEGACADNEACVAGGCVVRASQSQNSCSYSPTKACDPGEDGDCADNHACVEGLCRSLACQTQPSCNNPPTRPCEADDGDCAADHVCVANLCRKLACQTQPSCSYAGTRPCEADDDCAAEHACVFDTCRKLACQAQPSCSYAPTDACDSDDGDCAPEHVCVDELCRKLACQTQSSCGYAPTRPCADSGDCAAGNSCNDAGLCAKDACQ